jgi:hypothetical protein
MRKMYPGANTPGPVAVEAAADSIAANPFSIEVDVYDGPSKPGGWAYMLVARA